MIFFEKLFLKVIGGLILGAFSAYFFYTFLWIESDGNPGRMIDVSVLINLFGVAIIFLSGFITGFIVVSQKIKSAIKKNEN